MTEKAGEKKGVSLIAAIALGIVCTILAAALVGAVLNYTSVISGKDSTLTAKDSQISSLDSQISGLQDQISMLNSTGKIQPIQFSGSMEVADGNLANGVTYFYVVPNETRLVIERVSARVHNLDPSDTIDLYVVTWVNDTRVEHYLGVAGPQGRVKIDPYSQAYQFLSQQVQIYADPGTHVSVGGNRVTRLNKVTVTFSMSGYLIDAP